MSETLGLSIIIPVFNAEKYLLKCINSILEQNIHTSYEIILIDDASTDESLNIIKTINSPHIKIQSLLSNSGPGSARNAGLKVAEGEYVFFLDADDTITKNSINTLYTEAKANDFDLVICDKKLMENEQNKREGKYIYNSDKTFDDLEITSEIKKRIFDPLYLHGLIGITGRMIKASIIKKNKLFFQDGLRYLEDEIFSWDILSHCKKVKYIREQLYSYYVYKNQNTGISEGINRGYPLKNFKIAKNHVYECFLKRKIKIEQAEKLANQAFIFFIISALVSFSRSIILGKVNFKEGSSRRKELINDILRDKDIKKAIKNYQCSKYENKWIPKAIYWRLNKVLEFLCNVRAKESLAIRQKS